MIHEYMKLKTFIQFWLSWFMSIWSWKDLFSFDYHDSWVYEVKNIYSVLTIMIHGHMNLKTFFSVFNYHELWSWKHSKQFRHINIVFSSPKIYAFKKLYILFLLKRMEYYRSYGIPFTKMEFHLVQIRK